MRTADLNIATAELDERISVGRGRERGNAALPTTDAGRRDKGDSGYPAASVPSAAGPHRQVDAPPREHRTAA